MAYCRFCDRELLEKHGVLYKDKLCTAVLDRYPNSRGHTLIIPNKHHKDILTTDDKTLAHMAIVAKKISKKIEKRLGAKGFKLLVDDGKAADQSVMHLHIHIIPAYKKTVNLNGKRHKQITEKEKNLLLRKLTK